MKRQLVTIIFLIATTQTLCAQTANDLVKKAIAKIRNKDYQEAITDCDSAIAIAPQNAGAFWARGYAKNKTGGYADAIADLDRVISLDQGYQKFALVYIIRGDAKFRSDNFSDAITDYNQAIALKPNDTNAYFSRGEAYYQLGYTEANYQKAIQDYDAALKLGGSSYTPAYPYRDDAVTAMRKWWLIRSVFGFIFGVILGLIYCFKIIFPIFYFFPKSVLLVFKGVLRSSAILKNLIAPFIFLSIGFLTTIGYFENAFLKQCIDAIAGTGISINNPFTLYTSNIIVLFIVLIAITKGGRLDLKEYFWKEMNKHKKTNLSL